MIPTRRSPRLHPKSQPSVRKSASSKATKENKSSSRKIQKGKESCGRDHKGKLSDNPRARNPNIAPPVHLVSDVKTQDYSIDRISLPPGDSQSFGVLDSTESFERLHPYRAGNSGCSEFSSNRRQRSCCPSPESEQARRPLKKLSSSEEIDGTRPQSCRYILSEGLRYRFDRRQPIMEVSDPRGNWLNREVMCVDLLPLFE